MNKIITGIGEILWDRLPEGKRLGGAPANFAWHAAQAGMESCIVSAIGKDNAGDEILHELEKKGLPHLIATTAYPTGSVDVELDPQGVPHYHIREQVAWDYIPFHPSTGRSSRPNACGLLRYAGTTQRRYPRHHQLLPRHHAGRGRPLQDL